MKWPWPPRDRQVPGRLLPGWRRISGAWQCEDSDSGMVLTEPMGRGDESAAIYEGIKTARCAVHVSLRLLTESCAPPQGGAIVYFLFKNPKNHYSFHFCLPKGRVEFVKRYKGSWSVGEGVEFPLRTHRQYEIDITSDAARHTCSVDGSPVLTVHDADIAMGSPGVGAKCCGAEFRAFRFEPL